MGATVFLDIRQVPEPEWTGPWGTWLEQVEPGCSSSPQQSLRGLTCVSLLPRGEERGQSQGNSGQQALRSTEEHAACSWRPLCTPLPRLPSIFLSAGLLAASLVIRAQLICYLLQKPKASSPCLATRHPLCSVWPSFPLSSTSPHQPWSFLRAGHLSPCFFTPSAHVHSRHRVWDERPTLVIADSDVY